jgi:hypothetical protein
MSVENETIIVKSNVKSNCNETIIKSTAEYPGSLTVPSTPQNKANKAVCDSYEVWRNLDFFGF